METKLRIALLGLLLLTLAGCASSYDKSDAWQYAEEVGAREELAWTNGMSWPITSSTNEFIMHPTMVIAASTSKGEISVRAGENFERFYTWDGAMRSAQLWPRKKRWYGSMGIYYPGPGEHWQPNNGVTRGVLDEGILWFKSIDDALAWINRSRSTGADCVYSDTGLMVVFNKVPGRRQINVGVWQVMVDGQKPKSLVGSQNGLISVQNP